MDVSEKFKEIIGDLVESELSINDGDKIVYFLSTLILNTLLRRARLPKH